MVPLAELMAFGAVAVGMVLTPGPNMAYLVSRSVCQGRSAGLISLCGVATGFFIYLFLASFGLTAMAMAVPFVYDTIRWAGAGYLAWLAWKALRTSGTSPFEVQRLSPDSGRRLYAMGLLTNLLNPKAAMLYVSLLPQFIDPSRGSVLGQSLALGAVQISISVTFNALIVLAASRVALFLTARPRWGGIQRKVMGTVLGGMAVRMAWDSRR